MSLDTPLLAIHPLSKNIQFCLILGDLKYFNKWRHHKFKVLIHFFYFYFFLKYNWLVCVTCSVLIETLDILNTSKNFSYWSVQLLKMWTNDWPDWPSTIQTTIVEYIWNKGIYTKFYHLLRISRTKNSCI